MRIYQTKLQLSFLLLIIFIFTMRVSLSLSQNLILNPGCEDSLIAGEIPYWTEVIGTNWTQRANGNPPTYEGENMFFPGVATLAELQQDVDLTPMATKIDSNNQTFLFEGYVRAYLQSPPDESRIILEYLDALKTVKLDSFDSGNYSNTAEWVRVADTCLVPAGTRYLRIRLISTRHNGQNNDGYYDALSLTVYKPTSIEKRNNNLLTSTLLNQNYPNPFNPSTTISYAVGAHRNVPLQYIDLSIYNILGQKVTTLVSENQIAGMHSIKWDGSGFPGGVYFYQIKAGDFIQTKRMLLIK